LIKAAPTAPLARRQRRAQPWEARPSHAGPHARDVAQISSATRPRTFLHGTAVLLGSVIQLGTVTRCALHPLADRAFG